MVRTGTRTANSPAPDPLDTGDGPTVISPAVAVSQRLMKSNSDAGGNGRSTLPADTVADGLHGSDVAANRRTASTARAFSPSDHRHGCTLAATMLGRTAPVDLGTNPFALAAIGGVADARRV